MSLNQIELNEGPVEGDRIRLACSECGRVYHEIAALHGQNQYGVRLDYPVVPCHAGMVKVTDPPSDPFKTVQRVLGVLPKVPTFRALVKLVDGMIAGYDVEEMP